MVVGEFQGLRSEGAGAARVQAGPARELLPRLAAMVLGDQREAPAAEPELRGGDAGAQAKETETPPHPTALGIPSPQA